MKRIITIIAALLLPVLVNVSCQKGLFGPGIAGRWFDVNYGNPDTFWEIDEEGYFHSYVPRIRYEGELVNPYLYNLEGKFLVIKFEDGVLHVRNHDNVGRFNSYDIPAGTPISFEVEWVEQNLGIDYRVDPTSLSVYYNGSYMSTLDRVNADTYEGDMGKRLCRIKEIVYE